MSVINKMLRDLDRRNAAAAPQGAPLPQQVQSVAAGRGGHEWFWRIIAVLMVLSAGWVAWVVYQIQPNPLATDSAFAAAEQAKRAPKPKPAPAQVAPKPSAPPPEVAKKREPPELFRLARVIEAQIVEGAAPRKAAKPKAKAGIAAPKAVAGAEAPRLEKVDRALPAEQRAEAEFRRGVLLLNLGRVSEAEQALRAALEAYPGHEAARQALVALQIERGQLEDARRLLQEGMALNPSNAQFATVLARIFVERRDYAAALDALDAMKPPAVGSAEYQALRGMVLQRLNRHLEAVDAFNASLRAVPESGTVWIAYALSLETIGRPAEAGEAYRRALAAEGLGEDLRRFAERRARQLR